MITGRNWGLTWPQKVSVARNQKPERRSGDHGYGLRWQSLRSCWGNRRVLIGGETEVRKSSVRRSLPNFRLHLSNVHGGRLMLISDSRHY